jgi:Clp amino terminal domain, pathogenicity island component
VTPKSTAGDAYHPWTTYIWAREEARRRGDHRVGTDHLLLGLLHDAAVRSAMGVDLKAARDALDSLDRQALEALGMTPPTLDAPALAMREAPPRPTLKAVLKDRLPLTPAAKGALREAGTPMRHGRHINPQQVLLELLDLNFPDPAVALFTALGIDRSALKKRLDANEP